MGKGEVMLKSLPEENYLTARRVLVCLHKSCFKDKGLYDSIANFFLKGFMRFPDDGNDYSKNFYISTKIMRNFIEKIEDLAPLTPLLQNKDPSPSSSSSKRQNDLFSSGRFFFFFYLIF